MYCKKCGCKINKDENYCPDCGTHTVVEYCGGFWGLIKTNEKDKNSEVSNGKTSSTKAGQAASRVTSYPIKNEQKAAMLKLESLKQKYKILLRVSCILIILLFGISIGQSVYSAKMTRRYKEIRKQYKELEEKYYALQYDALEYDYYKENKLGHYYDVR